MSGLFSIPAATYHGDPCDDPSLSASIIQLLCTASPKHAWTAHPKLNPDFKRDDDAKYSVGTAAHAILLEGDATGIDVLEFDNFKKVAAQEARDASWAAGRTPLLAKDMASVTKMIEAVYTQLADLDLRPTLLTDGQPEQTLIWEQDGVTCRAMFDWIRDDLTAVDDLKTTSRSANPKGWARSTLTSIGADIQAAFYLRGLEKELGVTDVAWRWLIVENYPPYALSVVTPGPDVLTLADAKIDYAIRVWKRCLASGEWPAYPPVVHRAELQPWDEVRWYENEEALA